MDPDTVPVAWFGSSFEAELARSRLEAEGLAAWIVESSVLGTGWCHPDQPGGIALMTRESDAEEARSLLAEIEEEYEEEIPDEYAAGAENEACPECGSTEKRFEHERTIEVLANALGNRFLRADPGPHWRCQQCGHRWHATQSGSGSTKP